MRTIIILIALCGAAYTGCSVENAVSKESQEEKPVIVPEKSMECDILEFIDEVNSVNWKINGTNITATYPAGFDLSSIAPVIVVSEKASVNPPSGTKTNFSNEKEVTYIVIAEDGNEKDYNAQAKSEGIVFNNNILEGTKWKLIKVSISKDYQQPEIFDYSEKNIIYEFQGNNKLLITGNVDDLFIFDDFQEGEHFYEYNELIVSPYCSPGPNLTIDNPEFGQMEGCYYCIVDLDNKTMRISGNDNVIEGVYHGCNRFFTKLN